VAPGARSGYRPTGLEAADTELASGMGFPPLLATKSNYRLFFKDVKFFEQFFEHSFQKSLQKRISKSAEIQE
jgi:hypothetical protein